MSMLNGDSCKPWNAADAKKLIGQRIEYLRISDVDRSGRGYYFPRRGVVVAAKGRRIAIDDEWNWYGISDFVEIVRRGT